MKGGTSKSTYLRVSFFSLTKLKFRTPQVCGLVRRHAYSLLHVHPYANAFNFNDSNLSHGHHDDQVHPPMSAGVWEAKYEVDSLAAFLRLSRSYYQHTHDLACFQYPDSPSLPPSASSPPSSSPSSSLWLGAVRLVLDTLQAQQAGTLEHLPSVPPSFPPSLPPSFPYTFQRETRVASETQWGAAGEGGASRRCALVRSAFRPSDDATLLPFHLPGNAMLSVELKEVGKMLEEGGEEGWGEGGGEVGRRCLAMGEEIGRAVEEEGVVWVKRREGGRGGKEEAEGGGCGMEGMESVYAYEVRGQGEGGREGGR
ncbi:meiotically up-regulated, partial [Nannochloropsis gaditana]